MSKVKAPRAPRPLPGQRYLSKKQWIAFAEELAHQHGGKLPNAQWLLDNGLWALYQHRRRNPELYNHIPMVRKTRPQDNPQSTRKHRKKQA